MLWSKSGVNMPYDTAGNMLAFKDPIGSGTRDWSAFYDAENKQRYYCAGVLTACTAAAHDAEYVYDGEGNRVLKQVTNGATTTYVYDAFGRRASEYTVGGPSETAGTFYRTTDHLGSTRLVTDSSGAVVSRRDFFPFGEQILAQSSSGRQGLSEYNAEIEFPQLFTAKERDDESGLDYFLARYYSGSLGRFTSVDPGNAGSELTNPQLWNGYAYTGNNPLGYVDPDGLDRVKDIIQGVGQGLNNFVKHAGDLPMHFANDPGGTTGAVLSGASAVAQDPGLIADALVQGIENYQAADTKGKAAIATEGVATVVSAALGVGLASKSGGTVQTLGKLEATAATASGSAPLSRVGVIVKQIDEGGFSVKANPKGPNQTGNVTITHPGSPRQLNLRIETGPTPQGTKPHANVQVMRPNQRRPNKLKEESNVHITEDGTF